MSDSKTVTVYVRRERNTRTLAFARIPEIPAREALEKGCAIDGNQYVMAVEADTADRSGDINRYGTPEIVRRSAPVFEQVQSLHENLRQTQLALVEWLESLAYKVTFE